jgi:hypothetical protein
MRTELSRARDLLDQLDAIDVLQRDVDDDQVGPGLGDDLHGLGRRRCFAAHPVTHAGLDQLHHAPAHDRMVIDDQKACLLARSRGC